MAKSQPTRDIPSDEQPLTEARARWLSKQTQIPLDELRDKRLVDVYELIRPHLDPELLFFRKVCGRVVKRDPVTGNDYGVPNATVDVEDTDFSLLGFYPQASSFWWGWPFRVRRETIAQVRTDACGHFCVWVPRWDIDRILRLRRKMVCSPILPNLTEIIDRYRATEVPRKPIPDPGPLRELPVDVLRQVSAQLGPEVAVRLARATQPNTVEDLGRLQEELAAPAFPSSPPAPPLEKGVPQQLRQLKHPALNEAKRLGLEELDSSAFIGPFLRCHLEWALEWQTVIDIPDITFRVTQDVDGDGDEETIYSEGFFDVRWDMGEIPDVTLHASAIALSTPYCSGREEEERACEDVPEIYAVGEMPLDPSYHDSVEGYALRVNRPRTGGLPSGAPIDPARSPYAGWLALKACHRIPGATHQRVMWRTDGTNPVPLFVPDWNAPTQGPPLPPVVKFHQDPDGWIEIRPPETLDAPNWVLHWPTPSSGRYFLHIECRDGSGNVIGSSDEVAFTVDNGGCALEFGTIMWCEAPAEDWEPLPAFCPVIRRKAGATVRLKVPWSADSLHFRDARLDLSGCGAGGSQWIAADSSPSSHEQWHDSVSDTHGGGTALYTVSGSRPDGAYTLHLGAWTRAFQPGYDAGPTSDHYFDPSWIWSHLPRAIAIVAKS